MVPAHPNLPKRYIVYLLALSSFILYDCSRVSADETAPVEIKKASAILQAKYSRELTDIVFESTTERLQRGEYLTEGLYCTTCHSEKDKTKPGGPAIPEMKFAGAERYKTDSTHLYAPNLTSDEKTGIGLWSDDMLARAMQEGVGHDGRALLLPGRGGMPWNSLRNLTDEDLASIIVYLRSLPAIENAIPQRNIGDRLEQSFVPRPYPKKGVQRPVNMDNQIERGTYLINLAHCNGCHRSDFGGGFRINKRDDKNIVSPNISSDITGIGGWTEEAFISTIRNGKGKSGELDYSMPWISFRNLSDEDLAAIYTALMKSIPFKHLVLNNLPDSYCEICNLDHGGGDMNKREVPPDNLVMNLPSELDGLYVSQDFLQDTLKIFHEEAKTWITWGRTNDRKWPLIAVNDSVYRAQDFQSPYVIIRNEEGKIIGLKNHLKMHGEYARIE